MFSGIGALTAASTVDEMFQTVLVDSPIGPLFVNRTHRDFDEASVEYLTSDGLGAAAGVMMWQSQPGSFY